MDYEKARQTDPANSLYILHEKNARVNASMLHLKNGRQMLKEGRLDEAAGEFQKAVRIDPTNQAAAQELDAVLTKQAQTKKAHTEAIQKALKAREEENQPTAVKLQPFPQEPLAHFRLSADSRRVFETLGKLAGLNVAFTPDFRPAPLSEDLSGVKIEDALKLVAMQSKSFWKVVTPNTILVIPDNPNNRRDYDEEVLKTIYLSNPLARLTAPPLPLPSSKCWVCKGLWTIPMPTPSSFGILRRKWRRRNSSCGNWIEPKRKS